MVDEQPWSGDLFLLPLPASVAADIVQLKQPLKAAPRAPPPSPVHAVSERKDHIPMRKRMRIEKLPPRPESPSLQVAMPDTMDPHSLVEALVTGIRSERRAEGHLNKELVILQAEGASTLERFRPRSQTPERHLGPEASALLDAEDWSVFGKTEQTLKALDEEIDALRSADAEVYGLLKDTDVGHVDVQYER